MPIVEDLKEEYAERATGLGRPGKGAVMSFVRQRKAGPRHRAWRLPDHRNRGSAQRRSEVWSRERLGLVGPIPQQGGRRLLQLVNRSRNGTRLMIRPRVFRTQDTV
jgi:hypothetical protein